MPDPAYEGVCDGNLVIIDVAGVAGNAGTSLYRREIGDNNLLSQGQEGLQPTYKDGLRAKNRQHGKMVIGNGNFVMIARENGDARRDYRDNWLGKW